MTAAMAVVLPLAKPKTSPMSVVLPMAAAMGHGHGLRPGDHEDIFASFTVGFYRKGNLIMNPVQIARNYILGWCTADRLLLPLIYGDETCDGAEATTAPQSENN